MVYTLEDTSPRFLTFCLAFANTAAWHASPHPEEGITTLKDLIDWEQAKGILPPELAARLNAEAEMDPERAESARLEAIQFRETVYRVFATVAAHQSPARIDLERINAVLQQGLSRAGLTESSGGFSWGWAGEDLGYECLLWPTAHSAARLLTDEGLRPRIRQCADDRGCGVLFLDRTRNHSRRWCSMKSCGNRAKVARHYHRQHQVAS